MKLISDTKELEYELLQGSEDIEIEQLVYDSRKDCNNAIFVCMIGSKFDSHDDIERIVNAGAKAIVVERDCEYPKDITVIKVKSSRKALALLSATFWGDPIKSMISVAVTGTKGKTSTTMMIRNMLKKAGKKVGVIGTNGIFIGEEYHPSINTTPESYELHRYFLMMKESGCDFVVMEASSQGVKLDRSYGIEFDYAIFNNISKDHIGPDEHKDFEEYLDCKAELFTQSKTSLVNIDDKYASYITQRATSKEIYTFGEGKEADFICEDIRYIFEDTFIGAAFRMNGRASIDIRVSIPGKFNCINALAALSLGKLLGLDDSLLKTALEDIQIPGRMEVVYNGSKCKFIVDYAHNALSMESLLDTLRDYNPGRLVVVFGCGGNRSKDRRYDMGAIAGKKADFSIVTADNSRFEKVEDIIADIRSSIEKYTDKFIEISDRREAISYAFTHAKEGDIIAVIGKGHENYQEVNGVRYHFLDSEVIKEVVGESN